MKTGPSFSEEKEAKRLLFLCNSTLGFQHQTQNGRRSSKSPFASFSLEKEDFSVL
jgi:hypothetical protein